MAKPNNGEGESGTYLLVFNQDIEEEVMAWEMKQQLARNRKLKRTLIGFLSAMYKYQEENDKFIDVDQFISQFIHGMSGGFSARALDLSDEIEIDDSFSAIGGAVSEVDEDAVVQGFQSGMGSLFSGDDDDDLWDD